ncbi:hypothetical protein [Eggerthella sinensis]|uniref:hypothetical protein n=1 Tax=Eggerthella sinensis TaxID=242230 RepID=UPI00248ED8F4|nr:hypothetical protein [Eggerthella sinensis]
MNAKEGSNRPAALGRGLDTLMGRDDDVQEDWKEAQEAVEGDEFQELDGGEAPEEPARRKDRSLEKNACLVGGLIASGAAGAVAVAAFTLLGVRAVLSMSRRRW